MSEIAENLTRLLSGLKDGENISLTFALMLSFASVVLGIVGGESWALAGSLAVMGLLASGLIGDRWSREDNRLKMNQRLDQMDSGCKTPNCRWEDLNQDNDFVSCFQWATKVKVVAVSPSDLVRKYHQEFHEVASKPSGSVKFLAVDPCSSAMDSIAKGRKVQRNDGEYFFRNAKTKIAKDNAEVSKSIEVKAIDHTPSCIITIFESTDGESLFSPVMFVTVYSFEQYRSRPSFKVTRFDERYKFFLTEFEHLWNSADPPPQQQP